MRDARERLALALDVPDLDEARMLAERLSPCFATVKVGLELYTGVGPAAVSMARELGFRVFLDLKMYDIPTTVWRAARVAGRQGVDYINFHTAGGVEMVRAGVEGFLEGAADAGHPPPVPLGFCVLTSEPDARALEFDTRLAVAVEAGCGGVVCSAQELGRVKDRAAGLVTVVPGTRPAGAPADDHVRVVTPEAAARAGADLVVVGRSVTRADEPEVSARAVLGAVAEAIGAPR